MADYQEYRRRVLHRRWRRRFMAAGLLFLLVLLGAVSVMWKRLHRDPAQTRQDTILQEITEDNTWNTLQYASTRPLTVQTLSTGTTTALDFRMAALPRTAPVEKSNAIVNGTSCKRADGVAEVPLDALTAQQPKAVYLLLGTNVLGTDSDYTSFLTYYRLMLDMITQALPGTPVYVQSVTPVRPEVAAKKGHEGLNRDRLCRINDELAAVALEKNCYFLNLWEVLADENGDLKAEYAQPDGYHLKPEGYTAWVDYLCSHTAG